MSSPQKKTYTVSELKGYPGIGMFFPILKDSLGFMMDTSQRCGDIISFPIVGVKTIQLNHPDLIRYVLMENHKNYKKSKFYIRFESAIGLGLVTSYGEKWKRDRQKIQPFFNRSWISDYHFDIVNHVTEKYKQKWLALTENGKAVIDITDEMARITIEVILKAVFGKGIDDEMVDSLHHSYHIVADYLKYMRVLPKVDLRKLFRLPAYFEFKKELDNINTRISALSEPYHRGAVADKNSMLSLLLDAQKNNPDHFSDTDIRDHCSTMIFAGFETTSILLQWMWYLLDERVDVAEKLRAEIVERAPGTATQDSSGLTFAEVQRMDYLSAVMKETLRLYPSFWITSREAIDDDYFGDFKVPRGTAIVVPQLAMQRHPAWWDHPNCFMPERFMGDAEARITDGSYFPFSQGPRKCIGAAFTEMEAKTVIAKLLPLFDVVALNKVGNSLRPDISLKLRHSLKVRIGRKDFPK